MSSWFPSCVQASSWSTKIIPSLLGPQPSLGPRVPELRGCCWLAADTRGLSREGLHLFSVSSSFHRLPCRVHTMHTFPPSCFLPPVVLCFFPSAGNASKARAGLQSERAETTSLSCAPRAFLGGRLSSLPTGQCPVFPQKGADGAALLLSLGRLNRQNPIQPPVRCGWQLGL